MTADDDLQLDICGDALTQVFDVYLESGTSCAVFRSAWRAWTSAAGLRDADRDGVYVALDDDRVLAAYESRPTDEQAERDAWWAIVKDAKGMNATGHGAAVRWARAHLGLNEPEVYVEAHIREDLRRALPRFAWRYRPERCVTCDAQPSGRFDDGSPGYSCRHDPVRLDVVSRSSA